MNPPWRWLTCVSLLLAALVTTPSPAAALEIQACVGRAGDPPLDITSDPAACPAATRVDAIAASISVLGNLNADPVREPLVVTKNVDPTSALLFLHAVQGAFLRNVLVVFFDGTGAKRGNRVLSILLTTAWIKRFSQGAQDQKSGPLVETVEFDYGQLQVRNDASGSSGCWNFDTNRPC